MDHEAPLLTEKACPMAGKAPPVWMFSLLVLPYAVYANGFVNTLIAAKLTREGVPLDRVASILATVLLPTMLYFLWSPLVDFWLRRRSWVALASGGAGVALTTALLSPKLDAAGPRALLVVGMAVVMLTSCGVGGLMAAVVPPEQKARASAFFNAGSLGFGAIAGGGLLYLLQHMARGVFGLVCGMLVALPGLLALTIREAPLARTGVGFGATLREMGREFHGTFLRWAALPVLLLLVAPLGSGAALSLLPGIAPAYGVSQNLVAAMNGVAGGLLSALGALAVGYGRLPADLRAVYAAMGMVNGLTLGVLLLGPPRPLLYLLATGMYCLTVGACYAVFTALVLQLLGVSGKSGGSRYAIALSLGNAPVTYMTKVDGLGVRWLGLRGLPLADLTVSCSVAAAFLLWFWWERRRGITGSHVTE